MTLLLWPRNHRDNGGHIMEKCYVCGKHEGQHSAISVSLGKSEKQEWWAKTDARVIMVGAENESVKVCNNCFLGALHRCAIKALSLVVIPPSPISFSFPSEDT